MIEAETSRNVLICRKIIITKTRCYFLLQASLFGIKNGMFMCRCNCMCVRVSVQAPETKPHRNDLAACRVIAFVLQQQAVSSESRHCGKELPHLLRLKCHNCLPHEQLIKRSLFGKRPKCCMYEYLPLIHKFVGARWCPFCIQILIA